MVKIIIIIVVENERIKLYRSEDCLIILRLTIFLLHLSHKIVYEGTKHFV